MSSQLRVDNILPSAGTALGIGTASGSITFNSNISGDVIFNDDVTVNGVLTYEDVTNIDSVGVITARSDISIADKIVHTGDTDTAIRFPGADQVSIETGGTQRLLIGSDGKLVHSTSAAETVDFGTSNSSGSYHKYDLGSSGATVGYIGAGSQIVSGSNVADFGIRGQANLVFSSGGDTERLRITSAGNVGVNSTVPRSKLHVASGTSGYNTGNPTGLGAGAIASIESNGTVGLQFLSGNSHNNYIYFGDTNSATTGSIQYSHGANALIFNVNGGSERLRIDSSGNAILKSANAAFKSENPNSSGDYVRMYAGAGTAQWDIYGNGELLRMSENSSNSAARVQFDLPTIHRSTSNTTGAAAITAKQEVNNGGYSIYVGKNSSDSTVYYVTHNGRVGATEGIIFGSDTSDGNVLDDYEEGNYRSNGYIRLYDPNNTSSSFPILNVSAWNSQGYYTKTGGNVLVNHRIQSPLNSNISNLSSTTYDSYLIRITLPFTVGGLGRDTNAYARNTPCGIFYCSQMDTDHPFFMIQHYGEDYATISNVGTWGNMRTRLTSSPNYQWHFSINYTAS